MQGYILRRVLEGLAAILLMTVIVFALARLSGSPVDLVAGEYATDEDRARVTHMLGLDRPVALQYWIFLKNFMRGDLGESIRTREKVTASILHRFPATLQLAGGSLLVALVIAVPLGVITAVKRDTNIDTAGKTFAVLGLALPSFWLGLVFIAIFAVRLHWLPAAGRGGFSYMILPAVAMGWHVSAGILRLVRGSMLEVLDSEYIKLARIKGLPEWKVVWKHALRNAVIAPITFTAVYLGTLLAGSVVIETVFVWPGVGLLAIEAFGWRDYPLVQGIILYMTVLYIFLNLLVDILYAYVDPRIRLT
ncbi:MAG: ABC transporter permease [Chloroflexi bacterium]|nr:ABC transporter permease [Chloroflexota bacterium]